MIRAVVAAFASLYSIKFITTVVYMLQSVEYRPGPYLAWLWRTQNFATVMKRRRLDMTKPALLLWWSVAIGMFVQYGIGLALIVLQIQGETSFGGMFGLALLLAAPVVWAHLVALPLELGRLLIIAPKEQKHIAESRLIFASHPAIKIAIAGSYGKTSMKELLTTVLGEAKSVAATPGNKNVAISHAYFAKRLTGKEEVLIIEYGEGEPGDVARFAHNTNPTHAVITGVAPAHLDRYKTVQAAGEDIFAVDSHVSAGQAYVNNVAKRIEPFLRDHHAIFNDKEALGYKVTNVKLTLSGTTFTLSKGTKRIALQSGLIGRHNVATLAFVAAFALELGLTPAQVKAGVAKTKPYEHRMQPYKLSGAWVIDDTYNGNIEGIRAGTALLGELEAKRKIYVSPGLVDQGVETEPVHIEMGWLIAESQPDVVVLMANSVTPYIQKGLEQAGFKGEIRIEHNPLAFYMNLEHFVAAGDIVLLQNDWTDNYH